MPLSGPPRPDPEPVELPEIVLGQWYRIKQHLWEGEAVAIEEADGVTHTARRFVQMRTSATTKPGAHPTDVIAEKGAPVVRLKMIGVKAIPPRPGVDEAPAYPVAYIWADQASLEPWPRPTPIP